MTNSERPINFKYCWVLLQDDHSQKRKVNQSSRETLTGQPIQHCEWGSHSAGMWYPWRAGVPSISIPNPLTVSLITLLFYKSTHKGFVCFYYLKGVELLSIEKEHTGGSRYGSRGTTSEARSITLHIF